MNKTEILHGAFFKELEIRTTEHFKAHKETGNYIPPVAYFFGPNHGLCSECFLSLCLVQSKNIAPLFKKEDYPWATIDELSPFDSEDNMVVGCYECGEIIAEADSENRRRSALRQRYRTANVYFQNDIDEIVSEKGIPLHEAVELHLRLTGRG